MIPKLRTTTKQAFLLNGLIHLHLRLGEICIRVRFGIALHLRVNIFIVIAFIHLFILGIFAAEGELVPLNFQPVPIVVYKPRSPEANVVDLVATEVKQAEKSSRAQKKIPWFVWHGKLSQS